MTPSHLAVKNFERFQHYRDRNPPWIKLYGEILTDATFLLLPEAAQAQLIKLWVLASQFGHPLPNNPRLLAGKIGTTGRSYIPVLIDAGFLILCEDPASDPLAPNDGNASGGLAESSALAGADARSRESSEFRVQSSEAATKNLTPTAFSDVTPIALTIWANRAITERWGEQPSPLVAAGAVELSEVLVKAGVEPDVVRLSIYRQCRESKKARPPRGANYFRPGIEDDWQAVSARRAVADSGEMPPAVAATNGAKPHRPPTATVGDKQYADSEAAFADFNRTNGEAPR